MTRRRHQLYGKFVRLRQRGFGWIGVLFYLAVAAAISAAIYGAYRAVVDIGVREEHARWAALTMHCDELRGTPATCVTDWTTAVRQREEALAANKQLASDVDGLRTQATACSAATTALQTEAAAAAAARDKALATAQTALTALASDKRAALARAASPSQGGTCDEKLSRITSSLNEVAVREVRDRPPTPAEAADLMGLSTKPADGHAPDPRLRVR